MNDLEQVYGVHAVTALLRHHPKRVKQLYLLQGRQDASVQAIMELAQAAKLAPQLVDRAQLDEKTEAVHQGVLA